MEVTREDDDDEIMVVYEGPSTGAARRPNPPPRKFKREGGVSVRNPRSGGGLTSLDGPPDGFATLRVRSEVQALADHINACCRSLRNGDRSSRFVAARAAIPDELEAVKRACLAMVAVMRRHQARARQERERKRARDQLNNQ